MNQQGHMSGIAFLPLSPLGMPALSKQTYLSRSLRILQWNSNSLGANQKINNLTSIIHNFDVVSLCETNFIVPEIRNYECIKHLPDREMKRKGVAMYIHESLEYRSTDFCKQLERLVESTAIEIAILGRNPLIIWNIYVHPTLHTSIISDIFNSVQDNDILIVGDLNSKCRIAGNLSTNPRGNLLERLLVDDELPYCVLNDGKPTFIRQYPDGIRSSVIDLAICNSRITNLVEQCETTAILDSDHVPVQTALRMKTRRLKPMNEQSDYILDPVLLRNIFQETEPIMIGDLQSRSRII